MPFAPTRRRASWSDSPGLKTSNVGMLMTLYRIAVFGLSSTLSLTIWSLSPFSDAISSLNDRALRRLLGARAFLRGYDYVRRRAVENLDPVVLGGEPVGDRPGAVGRAVIDHQHAKSIGRGIGEHAARGRDDRLDVLGLVVRRQYQPRLAGHRSAYPRACTLFSPHRVTGRPARRIP